MISSIAVSSIRLSKTDRVFCTGTGTGHRHQPFGTLGTIGTLGTGAILGSVIKANQVMPSVVAEVIRKAPLSDEKVAFAWRLAVGAAIDKSTTVRLADTGVLYVRAESPAWLAAVRKSTSLIQIRMADLLGEDAIKRLDFS